MAVLGDFLGGLETGLRGSGAQGVQLAQIISQNSRARQQLGLQERQLQFQERESQRNREIQGMNFAVNVLKADPKQRKVLLKLGRDKFPNVFSEDFVGVANTLDKEQSKLITDAIADGKLGFQEMVNIAGSNVFQLADKIKGLSELQESMTKQEEVRALEESVKNILSESSTAEEKADSIRKKAVEFSLKDPKVSEQLNLFADTISPRPETLLERQKLQAETQKAQVSALKMQQELERAHRGAPFEIEKTQAETAKLQAETESIVQERLEREKVINELRKIRKGDTEAVPTETREAEEGLIGAPEQKPRKPVKLIDKMKKERDILLKEIDVLSNAGTEQFNRIFDNKMDRVQRLDKQIEALEPPTRSAALDLKIRENKATKAEIQAIIDDMVIYKDIEGKRVPVGIQHPEWVGPVQGTQAGAGFRRFFKRIGVDEARFRNRVRRFRAITLSSLIGAAQSAQELANMVGVIPNLTDSENEFIANILETKENLSRMIKELSEGTRPVGVDIDFSLIPSDTLKEIAGIRGAPSVTTQPGSNIGRNIIDAAAMSAGRTTFNPLR